MIAASSSRGVGLPLLGGVALDERLVERAPDQRDRLLLEVARLRRVDLGGLLGDQRAGLVRRVGPAEELVDQREVHRERVDLLADPGEHAVLVAGELGEPVDVLPDALVAGVEQVRAVAVDLDPGLGLGLGVGVAADVRPALQHEHALVQLVRGALGDGQPEEAGADDDQVVSLVHDAPRVAGAQIPTTPAYTASVSDADPQQRQHLQHPVAQRDLLGLAAVAASRRRRRSAAPRSRTARSRSPTRCGCAAPRRCRTPTGSTW